MSELSAKALNEQIVRMRKVVEKSRVRLSRKLIRFVRRYKDTRVEKKLKKRIRFMEEVKAAKLVHNDDVTKFALINTKELKDLSIKDSTPPSERALYKMAVEKCLTEVVKSFRKEYPNWRHEVPFLLQRLGMQYQKEKSNQIDTKAFVTEKEVTNENLEEELLSKREMKPSKEALKMDENNPMNERRPQRITNLVKEKIEKVVQNLPKEVKKQRRKKFDKNSAKEVPIQPLPEIQLQSSPILKGQGVIKKLNLDENEDDITLSETTSCAVNKDEFASSSSFFLPFGNQQVVKSSNEEEVNQTVEKKQNESFSKVAKAGRSQKRTALDKNSVIDHAKRPMKDLVNDDDGLHPSWAARKRQAKQLARLKTEPPPKKIVFEDND